MLFLCIMLFVLDENKSSHAEALIDAAETIDYKSSIETSQGQPQNLMEETYSCAAPHRVDFRTYADIYHICQNFQEAM